MKIELKIPEDKNIDYKLLEEIKKNLSVNFAILENRTIEFESEDAYKLLKSKEIMNAYLLGFGYEDCKKLLKDDHRLEIIEIKSFLLNKNNRNRLKELRGRIIGEKGKAKRNIQELTKTKILIHRNVVGIIGNEENVEIAKRAIEMILEGRMHSTVYKFLTKELQKRKNLLV